MDLCLFCHYSDTDTIPNYVVYYLEKLLEVTDKVVLLTNDRGGDIRNISQVEDMGIEYRIYKNEGYDFGMYYKFIMNEETECDRLWLVNDSMVLFNNLHGISQWIKTEKSGYMGLTDNVEKGWHIQSYFLVFTKHSQKLLKEYMGSNGICNTFNEVVDVYEVGLSKFLIDHSVRLSVRYSYKDIKMFNELNCVVFYPDYFIKNGLPMIKKKVLLNSFRKDEVFHLKGTMYRFNKQWWSYIVGFMDKTMSIKFLKKGLIKRG